MIRGEILHTHDESRFSEVRRQFVGDLADEPLLVIDHVRKARGAPLLDLLRAELQDKVEVGDLPQRICAVEARSVNRCHCIDHMGGYRAHR